MEVPSFEWDVNKAALNRKKHRVEFEEAATVWNDWNRIVAPDNSHSEVEDRQKAIGVSARFRLLVVIFTKRYETIRIISARRANPTEARRYAVED
jgi:uncharacterized DUF497 family protein